MKALLVKPNNLSDHIQPSLGLAYLAQRIRDKHEVKIIDCIKDNILPEEFGRKIIKKYKSGLVGIRCYTFDMRNVKNLLKSTKKINLSFIIITQLFLGLNNIIQYLIQISFGGGPYKPF
jgi:hypothetical protein